MGEYSPKANTHTIRRLTVNYWQVAAGESARDYSKVFLQFGVMLIGSGNPGPFFERQDYYEGHHDWRAQVVRFARKVNLGDIVILKRPHHRKKSEEEKWQIRAVGRVTGDYDYIEQFEDVEGWDLQHCRKVEWVCPPKDQEHPEERKMILVNGLTMGTFRGVHKGEAIGEAEKILKEGEKQTAKEIPPPAKKISDEDLVETLIGNGLRPADAEAVIQTIWRVRRLARWYARYGRDMSEHETRTFLITPVLLALGWSEQKFKIEWKNVDVALFQDVYQRGKDPLVILESKRMGEGIGFAERQAQRYAKDYPGCSRLVVSDGIRYHLYIKQGGNWDMERDFKAYVNLLNLKERHPYWSHIGGAPELFVSLMPK
jgi:hypothetical protein